MGGRQPGHLAAVGRRGPRLIDATNGPGSERSGAAEEAAPLVHGATEPKTLIDVS
jgi:hypothetical protein